MTIGVIRSTRLIIYFKYFFPKHRCLIWCTGVLIWSNKLVLPWYSLLYYYINIESSVICWLFSADIYIYIYIYEKPNMKSFSNETQNFFFGKFCFTYILDIAKTVWILRIFSHKFTRNFVLKSFEHWTTLYLRICYFAPVISQRYIKYTLVHSSKLLACSFHVCLI